MSLLIGKVQDRGPRSTIPINQRTSGLGPACYIPFVAHCCYIPLAFGRDKQEPLQGTFRLGVALRSSAENCPRSRKKESYQDGFESIAGFTCARDSA